jgi:probable F420-dependent oxidoreductase
MVAPLKVGLNIVWVKPEHLVEFAQTAEGLGYESLWSGEHVCLPHKADWWKLFPGAEALGDAFTEDMVPFTPDSIFLDPMPTLAYLAAVTTKVRLGIGIYMLALRDAVLVGRTLATLDVLSNGRIDLAVGLGWAADEYAFTGNEWKTRGKRMNELIQALRVLFQAERPEFHGEFFDFPPIGFQPKPVQRPRMPIHVGGGGHPAMRRAATLGDGWYGTPEAIPEIRALLAEAGRENEPFEFSTITLQGPVARDQLVHLAEMGVQRVVVTPWVGTKVGEVGREGLADIERYAQDIRLSADV